MFSPQLTRRRTPTRRRRRPARGLLASPRPPRRGRSALAIAATTASLSASTLRGARQQPYRLPRAGALAEEDPRAPRPRARSAPVFVFTHEGPSPRLGTATAPSGPHLRPLLDALQRHHDLLRATNHDYERGQTRGRLVVPRTVVPAPSFARFAASPRQAPLNPPIFFLHDHHYVRVEVQTRAASSLCKSLDGTPAGACPPPCLRL